MSLQRSSRGYCYFYTYGVRNNGLLLSKYQSMCKIWEETGFTIFTLTWLQVENKLGSASKMCKK